MADRKAGVLFTGPSQAGVLSGESGVNNAVSKEPGVLQKHSSFESKTAVTFLLYNMEKTVQWELA